jgi:alpha-beta hydrolase superfamily lysophospholipase
METISVTAKDGTELSVYHWPEAAPRAVVHIAHGAAEHGARYARLAEALNAAGYAVFANDHRGHGRTAKAGGLGVFAEADGWNLAVEDLAMLVARGRDSYPGKPVVLMGHSMGSLMAQQFIAEHGAAIDAVILSGSTVVDGFAELLPALQQELESNGREAPCELMGELMAGGFNIGIDDPQTSHDWLSRDPAEVQLYLDDPFCGFDLSIGAWLDMLSGNRIPVSKSELASIPKQLPLYVIAGDRDPVSNNTEALQLLLQRYAEAGMLRVEHRFYAEGRHEMLNETNRDEVTADLIDWLGRVV